ncbi:MAG: PTS sugar transporter subunit IIA [Verrucomicrobia bacterium]|nr:MAG: PTS sugar transporter subunit IIA [Verrucomicrobiota bacterium]
MKLAKLLNPRHIVSDMVAIEHWPAILELVDHLCAASQFAAQHHPEIIDALQKREANNSTGIGGGVAIPHAFLDELEHVLAVFGRSRHGINFDAHDQQPVHLIILFIVPKKDYHLHLATLAAIAKMFTNREVCRCLLAAETDQEIHQILDPKATKTQESSHDSVRRT